MSEFLIIGTAFAGITCGFTCGYIMGYIRGYDNA